MRVSGTAARAFLAGIALVGVAGLGACSSSDSEQPAASLSNTGDGLTRENIAAARAQQGIEHPPADVWKARIALNERVSSLSQQGILHPPADVWKARIALNERISSLSQQGILHPPADVWKARIALNERISSLSQQGILHPPE